MVVGEIARELAQVVVGEIARELASGSGRDQESLQVVVGEIGSDKFS